MARRSGNYPDRGPQRKDATVDTFKDSGDATSAPAFDLLIAIREEQATRGRHVTDSELDRFSRAFYAPEYRRDLRRIMAVGCEEPNA